jgi:hypothetical protein
LCGALAGCRSQSCARFMLSERGSKYVQPMLLLRRMWMNESTVVIRDVINDRLDQQLNFKIRLFFESPMSSRRHQPAPTGFDSDWSSCLAWLERFPSLYFMMTWRSYLKTYGDSICFCGNPKNIWYTWLLSVNRISIWSLKIAIDIDTCFVRHDVFEVRICIRVRKYEESTILWENTRICISVVRSLRDYKASSKKCEKDFYVGARKKCINLR